jgi:DNA repair protein RecN (Recombination protein N)
LISPRGFTVITDETDAGKSILIKSIDLLTGGRADLLSIHSGCSVCILSISFEYKSTKIADFLDNFSIPSENNIILIRRTVENTRKSRVFMNDLQVSVSLLAFLGKLLIDFHGQHERRSLLSLDSQLEILDNEVK